MPTTSLIAAVLAKYDTLTTTNFPANTRPPIGFDEMPQTNSVESGYIVLRDDGQTPLLLGFEAAAGWQTQETIEFTFEVYYPLLADVDTAVEALKRNGGTTAQVQGFDHGTLPDLATPRRLGHMFRIFERRTMETGNSKTGKLVHCCRLRYRVDFFEDA